jgi:hypothetical protein
MQLPEKRASTSVARAQVSVHDSRVSPRTNSAHTGVVVGTNEGTDEGSDEGMGEGSDG